MDHGETQFMRRIGGFHPAGLFHHLLGCQHGPGLQYGPGSRALPRLPLAPIKDHRRGERIPAANAQWSGHYRERVGVEVIVLLGGLVQRLAYVKAFISHDRDWARTIDTNEIPDPRMSIERRVGEGLGTLVRALAWRELYHPPQGIGRRFDVAALNGYFNDLTRKAAFSGPRDRDGLPLARGRKHELFYHPIVICQQALAHHDLWLITGDQQHRNAFLACCRWLVSNQKEDGGWTTFRMTSTERRYPNIGVPAGWHRSISPYSGMTQGEAISALVRAHREAGESAFLSSAQLAFGLLAKSVDDGGLTSQTGSTVSIEELPSRPRNTILNGWVFGMFGVYDLWLATGSETVRLCFDANFGSLLRRIPDYDIGSWSSYDESGHIAKPFYHMLHVAQLASLERIGRAQEISPILHRWRQGMGLGTRAKALLLAAAQRVAPSTGFSASLSADFQRAGSDTSSQGEILIRPQKR